MVYCSVSPPDSELGVALEKHIEYIQQSTNTPIRVEPVPVDMKVRVENDEVDKIRGALLKVRLCRFFGN